MCDYTGRSCGTLQPKPKPLPSGVVTLEVAGGRGRKPTGAVSPKCQKSTVTPPSAAPLMTPAAPGDTTGPDEAYWSRVPLGLARDARAGVDFPVRAKYESRWAVVGA